MYARLMKWSGDELNIAESVESRWWGFVLNSPLPRGKVGTPAKFGERPRKGSDSVTKIQLKIISWLDLIFHHIVIVHFNLLRRNLTQHVRVFFGDIWGTLTSWTLIVMCAVSAQWLIAHSPPNIVSWLHLQWTYLAKYDSRPRTSL